jgi:hypothetical protein
MVRLKVNGFIVSYVDLNAVYNLIKVEKIFTNYFKTPCLQ